MSGAICRRECTFMHIRPRVFTTILVDCPRQFHMSILCILPAFHSALQKASEIVRQFTFFFLWVTTAMQMKHHEYLVPGQPVGPVKPFVQQLETKWPHSQIQRNQFSIGELDVDDSTTVCAGPCPVNDSSGQHPVTSRDRALPSVIVQARFAAPPWRLDHEKRFTTLAKGDRVVIASGVIVAKPPGFFTPHY